MILEDEHQREMPSVHGMYLPVRQSIYAILFNVHHQMYLASKGEGTFSAKIDPKRIRFSPKSFQNKFLFRKMWVSHPKVFSTETVQEKIKEGKVLTRTKYCSKTFQSVKSEV